MAISSLIAALFISAWSLFIKQQDQRAEVQNHPMDPGKKGGNKFSQ